MVLFLVCRRRRTHAVRLTYVYLQVDGIYAAVRFPRHDDSSSSKATDGDSVAALLNDCRLMHKDDLIVVKGTAAPKVPDCFQKLPKRISLGHSGRILAVSVDNQGTLDVTTGAFWRSPPQERSLA